MAHYLNREQDSQYKFEIDDLELPIAPSSLTVKINNKNETITLINEGEVNIPKLPGLAEISFTARIPQTQYPFANKLQSAAVFTDKFKALKLSKQPFQLTISRVNNNKTILNQNVVMKYHTEKVTVTVGGGQHNKPVQNTIGRLGKTFDKTVVVREVINPYGSSSYKVVLEDYTIKEDAEEGFDLLIDLNFKEYVPFSTKVYTTVSTSTADGETSTIKLATSTEEKPADTTKTYTVAKGDNLWKIARKFYGGTGSNYTTIYNANKDVVESTAKKYGKKSSSKGHWIYPGTKLTIPAKK